MRVIDGLIPLSELVTYLREMSASTGNMNDIYFTYWNIFVNI